MERVAHTCLSELAVARRVAEEQQSLSSCDVASLLSSDPLFTQSETDECESNDALLHDSKPSIHEHESTKQCAKVFPGLRALQVPLPTIPMKSTVTVKVRIKVKQETVPVLESIGRSDANQMGIPRRKRQRTCERTADGKTESQSESCAFESAYARMRRESPHKLPPKAKGRSKRSREPAAERRSSNGFESRKLRVAKGCESLWNADGSLCDALANCESEMVEKVSLEILEGGETVQWADICGLRKQKAAICEIVIWPLKNPSLFRGLRAPPSGVLLFGPPGTGKTMIAKAIASQSDCRFFCISASVLTSKWFGTAEKMVKCLFAVARCLQPSVIFIDEIDSVLSQRSSDESDAVRRVKTELLVSLDGANSGVANGRVLVIGATNRPQELDEAARRRLQRRLYVPLPDASGRLQLLKTLLRTEKHSLADEDFDQIVQRTDGYSAADCKTLAQYAASAPLRDLAGHCAIESLRPSDVRPISAEDFNNALASVRPSVAPSEIEAYRKWNHKFGSVQNDT